MPKVTEKYKETRRQQIMDAACACFARKGFHETSLRDICSEAKLSPGAVYLYFKNKDDLVESFAEKSRQQIRTIVEATSSDKAPTERLLDVVETFCQALGSPQGLMGTRIDISIWAAALSNPKLMALTNEAIENAVGAFGQIVEDAQQRGELNDTLPPDAVARVVMSLIIGMSIQRFVSEAFDIEQYVGSIQSLLSGTFA